MREGYNFRITPGWYPTARHPYGGLVCFILVKTYLIGESASEFHKWTRANGMQIILKYNAWTGKRAKVKIYFLRKKILEKDIKSFKIESGHSFKQLVEAVNIQIRDIETIMPKWFSDYYYEFQSRCTPPTDEELKSLKVFHALQK